MLCTTHSHDHATKKNGLFPASTNRPQGPLDAKPEVMRRGSGQENACHYPNPSSPNKIKMTASCGCLHRRRARSSTTPLDKKSKLSFVIKCQLNGTGQVLLMHRDDKTLRHFSGQFFCLFVSNILSNLSHRILYWIKKRKINASQEIDSHKELKRFLYLATLLADSARRKDRASMEIHSSKASKGKADHRRSLLLRQGNRSLKVILSFLRINFIYSLKHIMPEVT